jgi:hypothetical protein
MGLAIADTTPPDPGWLFLRTPLREPAHAFAEYRNGRKRDKLFLLPRASSSPLRKSR